MNKKQLIAFEQDIEREFIKGNILAPIHLSNGNELQLIEIFQKISRQDYVFSTWRNHYHALLHGLNPTWLKQEIISGRSMSINCQFPYFFSSAIVGTTPSIAIGTAMALKLQKNNHKVWCFIGDMGASIGAYYESHKLAHNYNLPITFIIEDNKMSVGSPTDIAWGNQQKISYSYMQHPYYLDQKTIIYHYKTKYPHVGAGKWVTF